jgi:pimeloyl-ACP methyl ester carboxylesterase
MTRVISKDGTQIAYDRQGSGPTVVLVGGGLADRSENAPLAVELARSFTVYNYDRRGRGLSGDTLPYAVDRELEDLEALITETGGSAQLYGVSSGGALVLEAAAAGLPVDRIGVYEVPYFVTDEMTAQWQQYVKDLDALLAENRRGDALALFMTLAGTPEEMIASSRGTPEWKASEEIVHTLAYDAACLGDGRPPVDRLAKLTHPALVATGASLDQYMQQLDPGFFDDAADAIVAAMPQAQREIVPVDSHVADPTVIAPILERFFTL